MRTRILVTPSIMLSFWPVVSISITLRPSISFVTISLVLSKAKSHAIRVVLNAGREKVYEGSDYNTENLANRQQAASVDRYYSIQP
jgi:hypothetical protein